MKQEQEAGSREQGAGSKRKRFGAVEWVLVVIICLLLSLLFIPRSGTAPSEAPSGPETAAGIAVESTSPEVASARQDWGIEVVGLYRAFHGRVLDLRYNILDVGRAAAVPEESGHIYLIDQVSGRKTVLPNSPRTGSVPQNPQKLQAGRTYSMSFPNPGAQFQSGDKLTLVIGSFRAENLLVQ